MGGGVYTSKEVKISTAITTSLPVHELLHQAEIQNLQLHSTGRALRAVADLTRRKRPDDGEYIEHARRDDVACLMEVLGENILQHVRAVDNLLSDAGRRPN